MYSIRDKKSVASLMKRIVAIVIYITTSYIALPAQNVKYLIPPYDGNLTISNFSEGFARIVRKGNHHASFIDLSGQEKHFVENYDYAGDFHDGLVWVSKEFRGKTLYGFMDKHGVLAIPYQFEEVEDFSCNRAAVNKGGVWQIIDKNGKIVMHDSLLITERQTVGASSRASEMEDVEPPAFHNGLMLVCHDGKYSYVNTSGKIVSPFIYYKAFDFSDGVAVVAMDTVDESLSYKGKEYIDSLYNSLPSGPTEYKWTVIDTTGKVLCKFKEKETPDLNEYFYDGYISFSVDSYKNGVMKKNGKIVILPQYENEFFPFSDGVTFVQVDDNKDDGNKNGYLLVIDTLGNTISKIPFTTRYGTMYDSNKKFHEGLMAVKVNDKWGYMDKKGYFVIPPKFSMSLEFHDGCAVVVTNEGKAAVIKNPLYN